MGVQRQLLLPLDDDHFCRFRSSWIENQAGPEHAATRGVLRLRRVRVAVVCLEQHSPLVAPNPAVRGVPESVVVGRDAPVQAGPQGP